MARQLRALTSLPEDPGSTLRTHMAAPGDLAPSETCRQNTNAHSEMHILFPVIHKYTPGIKKKCKIALDLEDEYELLDLSFCQATLCDSSSRQFKGSRKHL